MNIKKIRDCAFHYINPNVAAAAELSFEQRRQFAAGRIDSATR
jgi:hypothetical protein